MDKLHKNIQSYCVVSLNVVYIVFYKMDKIIKVLSCNHLKFNYMKFHNFKKQCWKIVALPFKTSISHKYKGILRIMALFYGKQESFLFPLLASVLYSETWPYFCRAYKLFSVLIKPYGAQITISQIWPLFLVNVFTFLVLLLE